MQQTNIFDYIEDNHYQYKKVFPCDHRIRIFEAFAGIGCQRLAAELLGIPYEVVGISEIDKQAGNGIVVNVFAEVLKGLIEVQND